MLQDLIKIKDDICLTGRVAWRGTAYGPAVAAEPT